MHDNIFIAGCGLSGMISALALAHNNLPSTIIERTSNKDQHWLSDIRTTALNYSTQQFFKEIGIWNNIAHVVTPINDIYIVDNKSSNMIHFHSSQIEEKKTMGYIIKNCVFKQILFQLVHSNKLITIIHNCSYAINQNTINNCVITLSNNKQYIADLFLICDGYNSIAKKIFFSSNIQRIYNQCALTFITHHEKSHEGTAVEHFMPTGPFAILPLQDMQKSSVVWTVDTDMQVLIQNLSKYELQELVQNNFGEFLGEIDIVSNIVSFPLIAYHTNKYFNKRIVLIADTAHIIHPLAGQGLNQGIKDIQCLLQLLLQHHYKITFSVLEKYEQSRKIDNQLMLEITDSINTIFSNHSTVLRFTRSLGFHIINRIPLLKKLCIKYAMGQRIHAS